VTKEHLTAAAAITSEMSRSCCSKEEPAQTSVPVSTTTAALAGSEDNSSPHWISDYTGRDGPFRSLSPSARGLPSPLETARALIAASDRKEALTGRRLFWHKHDGEILLKVAACDVPSLAELRPDVPRRLAEVVHMSLAKRSEDRFASADEMLQALTAILRTQPDKTDAKPIAASVQHARRVLV